MYAINNLKLPSFRYFVIHTWKYIFTSTRFIHAAFIHTNELFLRRLIGRISKIPLIFNFSHISIFKTVLEIISRIILSEKKKNILLFGDPFALNIVIYRDRKHMKRQTIWHIKYWNQWRNLEVTVIFLTCSVSLNWQKYHDDSKNELVSPRI